MITQRSSARTVQVTSRMSIEPPLRTPTPRNRSTSSDIRLPSLPPVRMNLRHEYDSWHLTVDLGKHQQRAVRMALASTLSHSPGPTAEVRIAEMAARR